MRIRASAFPMPEFAPVTTAVGMTSITVLLGVSGCFTGYGEPVDVYRLVLG